MIRTSDPLLPKQMRYQAALRPEPNGGAAYNAPAVRSKGNSEGRLPPRLSDADIDRVPARGEAVP